MKEINQKICVVGLGYIGLPTAALLANRGYQIHGVDVVQTTVDTINRGKIHIVEPELDTFVQSAINSKKLKASTVPEAADIFIIAVPTPFHEGYVPNVEFVRSATRSIAPFIKAGNVVILESTSPIGTTQMVADLILETRPELAGEGDDVYRFDIAYCPERVLPGRIMFELVQNDRIVGGLSPRSTQRVAQFYKSFINGEIFLTDAKTAEMAKLTENSFRDVNIAFANEVSMLCDKFGIDAWELINLTNRHPRVNVLRPGPGVGGHCIAVDPWFLVHSGGDDAKLIRTARERNEAKSRWVIDKIIERADTFEAQNSREPVIAAMGLAFKPDIDDLRESPALLIANELSSRYKLIAAEPNIPLNYPIRETITLVDTFDALEKADIIIFLVAHKQFRRLNVTGLNHLDFAGAITREDQSL